MTKAVQDLMVEVARVRDAFSAAVLAGDLEAALATVDADVVVATRPAGTGAGSRDALRRHLTEDVLDHLPTDLTVDRTSRTVDRWRVADELLVTFTHDRVLPWLLPEMPATGRRVAVTVMSVTVVRRSLVTAHRTLWDHATLLAELGAVIGDTPVPESRTSE